VILKNVRITPKKARNIVNEKTKRKEGRMKE
jgi:hypothetical protein